MDIDSLVHPKVSKSSDKTEEWYIKWTPTIIQITLKIDLGVSLALMDSNRCTFGSKTGKLVGSMITRKDAAQIWDIEDLRRTGKQMQGNMSVVYFFKEGKKAYNAQKDVHTLRRKP